MFTAWAHLLALHNAGGVLRINTCVCTGRCPAIITKLLAMVGKRNKGDSKEVLATG